LLDLLKSQATQPDSAAGIVESEQQLCSLLYTFPFFQHFEQAHVIAMAKLCDCVRILKGNVLFVQGDAEVESLFFIVQGSLSIHFHESASNEQMLAKRDDWAEQIPDKDVGSNSCKILEGLDPEQYFGKEIAVEGVGSTLGENALWDRRRQQCSPMGTGP
jgi:CRP-like cAMP-binding protein